jgi:hypothetical protein
MPTRDFFKLLLITTCASWLTILLLNLIFPSVLFTSPISWWSIIFFSVLSLAMYYTGKIALGSSNKMMFSNIASLFMFGKMFLSVIILLIYRQLFNPTTGNFVLPFVVVYLFFTIFETYFMVKLGKN